MDYKIKRNGKIVAAATWEFLGTLVVLLHAEGPAGGLVLVNNAGRVLLNSKRHAALTPSASWDALRARAEYIHKLGLPTPHDTRHT